MRYLITGGAGFIGSHLTDALVARGDQVVVLDDLSTGSRHNLEQALGTGLVEIVEGSVVDADLVDDCVAKADACFHLASAVGVSLILGKPLDSLLRNVRGNDVLIEATARHDRRLVFASTSEVYGKKSNGELNEDSDRTLGPPQTLRWSYSTAKALGESLIHAYNREHGYEAATVRIFNTVGPRQLGAYGMVLPRFVSQALEGKAITVFGDGAQSRCFTHVRDTVDAMIAVCDSGVNGTYNVGSPEEVPIIELARQVIERAESDSTIEFVPYERIYGDDFEELGRRKPNIAAIRAAVGWQPARTLTEMIDDTILHQREQPPPGEGRPRAVAIG